MEVPNTQPDDKAYSRNIAAGSFLMAHHLAGAERKDERKAKKNRVLERKRELIKETFDTGPIQWSDDVAELLVTDVPSDQVKTYLIDMAFSNPFAPYELKYKEGDFEEALKALADKFEVPVDTVDDILETKREAVKAHNNVSWMKIVGYGAAGIVALGLGGYFLAPAIAAALGSAAGLAGAAATAHGLALLGGGSLAAGGAGMAGGLWLVTGTAAVAGGTIAGGGTLLHQMGAAGARTELTKLQVTYKEVLLHNQVQGLKAQEALKSLSDERDQLKGLLEEEQELNEENAQRVRDLEDTLEALENAIVWMEEEAA
jgi:hypothetical protein